MAFKQSYSKPARRSSEPSTFAGKYSLKKIAGLDEIGKECYVIPLGMQEGYSVLPYHTLKKNGPDGFKGFNFGNAKIRCKAYDPATGERAEEEPLCCKLARLEKDRKPEKEDSVYRALSFTNKRYVIPVLVLSTTEEDARKKPSMRKVSLNGIDFSFLDLASSSYEEEFQNAVITQLIKDGVIEHEEDLPEEELLTHVQKYLQHAVIKVSLVKSNLPNIPYTKAFDIIPVSNEFLGKDSGEGKTITWLCKLLAGEVSPAKLNAFYETYPILKTINNQVIDYQQLFDDNVDSLVMDYEDEELQKYYDDYVEKQQQMIEYKEYNEKARANTEEEVSFRNAPSRRVVEDEEDFTADDFPGEPVATKARTAVATKPKQVVEDFDTTDLEESPDLDEMSFSDEDFELDEDDVSNFGFEG